MTSKNTSHNEKPLSFSSYSKLSGLSNRYLILKCSKQFSTILSHHVQQGLYPYYSSIIALHFSYNQYTLFLKIIYATTAQSLLCSLSSFSCGPVIFTSGLGGLPGSKSTWRKTGQNKIFSSLVTKIIKLTRKKILNIPFSYINIQLRPVPWVPWCLSLSLPSEHTSLNITCTEALSGTTTHSVLYGEHILISCASHFIFLDVFLYSPLSFSTTYLYFSFSQFQRKGKKSMQQFYSHVSLTQSHISCSPISFLQELTNYL